MIWSHPRIFRTLSQGKKSAASHSILYHALLRRTSILQNERTEVRHLVNFSTSSRSAFNKNAPRTNGYADNGLGILDGQVGVVTGAGTPYGIGRSLVLKLAEAGAKTVYACDLNVGNIASLKEEVRKLGSDCQVIGNLLDVSSEADTLTILKEIIKSQGRLDFFFANAGFANYRHVKDTELAHYDRQINVMQRSVFLAIKYGSQAMMVTSSNKPSPGGAFVVTGSAAGFLGSYADLSYTTAKTAVNGLVMGASVQLSASNIRINGIAPGFVQTSILTSSSEAEKGGEYTVAAGTEQIKNNHERLLKQVGLRDAPHYYYNRLSLPEEIADIGVFLVSDLSSAINGQVILADSGKTAAALGEAATGPVPPINPLVVE